MPVVPATPLFNPSYLVYGFFILIAGVIVLTSLRQLGKAKRRRKAVAEFAAERGWEHHEEASRDFLHTLPDTYPFAGGNDQGVTNLLIDGTLMSFDFHFWTETTTSDDTSSKVPFHVVLLPLPAPLPRVQISTKRGAQRQGGALRFESAAFNKSWLVYSEHPQAAYDVLHPRLMEWLQERKGNFVIQDERIYYWVRGTQDVTAIDAIASDLRAFVEQIPAHVWQKAQGEYPRPQRYSPVADLGRFVESVRQHYAEKKQQEDPPPVGY